jgi:farnesyl diphosphate synthase
MPSQAVTADQAALRTDSLDAAMKRAVELTDQALERLLPAPMGLHGRVAEAMRYAVFAGGKRLRPFLVLGGADLFGVPTSRSVRAAAAIEAMHTYSLVHDDLPCMDDDDLRRGRPTTHRQFDEATAVLAGDALLTHAFAMLADAETHPSGEVRAALIAALAQAAGADGMIGGQMMDMQAPERSYGLEEVILLQRMKTGALFEFCCEAGPILAQATENDRERLRSFARDFGLLFQVTDDLIDATGSSEQAGKAVGKDQDRGKATLVSLHGIDGARSEAARIAERAAESLSAYGSAAEALRRLPFFLLDRAT